MKAVHFGAGNIGRGFIGKLLYESGFEICFVDVNRNIVDLLNEKKEYRVQLANETEDETVVKNVSAINSAEEPELAVSAISDADLVTAAVGPNILPHIAGIIADGLKQRLAQSGKPLTIIACENMVGGTDFLKEKIYELLTEDEKQQFEKLYSFPNAAVDRIVPNQKNEDPLLVKVEPFFEWVVDASPIHGNKPPIEGIKFVEDLTPFIERKLFTVNTGHAATAYLGFAAGMTAIHEVLIDNEIKEAMQKTLAETGRLLIEKYKFDAEEHQTYIETIIGRFANPFIYDEVTRVGRSPIRKLQANDRFISPAKQYLNTFNEVPKYLVKAVAAAFRYNYAEDPDAMKVQETIEQEGIEAAIETYTGLAPSSALFLAIHEQYEADQKV